MQYKVGSNLMLEHQKEPEHKTNNKTTTTTTLEADVGVDENTIEEIATQLRKIGDEVDKECIGFPKLPCLTDGKLDWLFCVIRSL
jgi:hypothetical protein